MTTYYSIISALIRPEIEEKITIGLLLFDNGSQLYFSFSTNKLNIAKQLLPANSYNSLEDAIHNVQATALHQQQKTASTASNQVCVDPINSSYIHYLSRYNNNIMSFSAPKEIDVAATESVFNKLYAKFIDDSNSSKLVATMEGSLMDVNDI